jgi:hypothetical protein
MEISKEALDEFEDAAYGLYNLVQSVLWEYQTDSWVENAKEVCRDFHRTFATLHKEDVKDI